MGNKGFLKVLAVVLATSTMAACGGASFGDTDGGSGSTTGTTTGSTTGSTTGTTTPTATPAHISIVSSSPTINGANSATASSTITVTVTDSNNLTISGAKVTLTANKGALTIGSPTTDANGNVTATLTQGSAVSGDSIVVSAKAGSLAAVTTTVVVTATPVLKLGILSGGTFTAGTIQIGQTPLAAGGNSSLLVNIVDTANGNAIYTGSATVTFSSPCNSAGTSQITSPVTVSTGTVNSNYLAKGCSGNDLITATAVVGSTTLPAASATINVAAAALGGLKFVSATPGVIGLANTGQVASSVVIFQVVDKNGNPVVGANVNFTLSSTVGGMTLSPATAISDSSGNVQTTVNAGTVHTTVQVNASATFGGSTKTSQSNGLVISASVPTQNGLSLSAESLSIEGQGVDGATTTITARLTDRYGNGVPDGTPVSFTSECGKVDASCSTTNSACSVTFISQGVRTGELYTQHGNMNSLTNADQFALGNDDHRCTVMASAKGEESFTDANGNGLFDTGEFFVSLPEAFLDSNESGGFDLASVSQGSDETFTDFNSDATWNNPVSTQFIGLLCNVGTIASPVPGACAAGSALNVFRNIPIVLATGGSRLSPANNSATANDAVADGLTPFPDQAFASVAGKTIKLRVLATDSAGQVLPTGTTVSVSSSLGSVVGSSSFTIGNYGPSTVYTDAVTGITYPMSILNVTEFDFKLSVPTTATADGTVTISTTSPGGITTFTTFDITLPPSP